MRQFAAVLAADPLGVPGARRHLAVEGHRRLEQHPRAPHAGVLAEGLVEQPRARGQLAVGKHHLHALVAQDPEAPPGGLLGRVVRADDHAADPRLQDRLGAGRRLALVAAGLQRHVQRRLAQIRHPARLDRIDLGVRGAVAFVPALAQHLAVARDHRPHDGVRLDRPGAVLGQLDRPRQVHLVCLDACRHRPFRILGPTRLAAFRRLSLPATRIEPLTASAPTSKGRRVELIHRSARRAAGRQSFPAPPAHRPAGSSRSSSRS